MKQPFSDDGTEGGEEIEEVQQRPPQRETATTKYPIIQVTRVGNGFIIGSEIGTYVAKDINEVYAHLKNVLLRA